jgi:hypothetical protein
MKTPFALVAASLGLIVHTSLAQITYDASAQFDKTNNPSGLGPWSYGYYANSLGSGFTLFDKHFDIVITGGTGNIWTLLSDPDGLPQVAYNPNTNAITDGPTVAGGLELNLHSGGGPGIHGVLRFTAPSPGVYDVSSSFSGNSLAGTSTDVHVLRNGISIFNDTVDAYGDLAQFTTNMVLAGSDTLDFAVGDNGNGFANDSTGLFTVVGLRELPKLNILPVSSNYVRLEWPASGSNFILEATSALPVAWTTVTNARAVEGATLVVTNLIAGNRFYRLRASP